MIFYESGLRPLTYAICTRVLRHWIGLRDPPEVIKTRPLIDLALKLPRSDCKLVTRIWC